MLLLEKVVVVVAIVKSANALIMYIFYLHSFSVVVHTKLWPRLTTELKWPRIALSEIPF